MINILIMINLIFKNIKQLYKNVDEGEVKERPKTSPSLNYFYFHTTHWGSNLTPRRYITTADGRRPTSRSWKAWKDVTIGALRTRGRSG
jgi:hypothetical protein